MPDPSNLVITNDRPGWTAKKERTEMPPLTIHKLGNCWLVKASDDVMAIGEDIEKTLSLVRIWLEESIEQDKED